MGGMVKRRWSESMPSVMVRFFAMSVDGEFGGSGDGRLPASEGEHPLQGIASMGVAAGLLDAAGSMSAIRPLHASSMIALSASGETRRFRRVRFAETALQCPRLPLSSRRETAGTPQGGSA